MVEKARAAPLLWRLWAIGGVIAMLVSGVRLLRAPHPSARPAPVSIPAKVQPSERVEVALLPAVPMEDRVLARLRTAETSTEECELLNQLEPSEDPEVTYAVTDVLERSQFRSVRSCATSALGRQPTPPAQSWLIDLAEDPEVDVHRAALEALAAHGDSSAQAVVVEAAHSDDGEIVASAVIALLKAHQSAAVAAAVAILGSVDQRETLLALVDALGQSRDPGALPVLSELVGRAEHDTHLRAISALGDLGQKQAEPLLSSLLEVGSDDEYRAAAKALAKLAPESVLGTVRASLNAASEARRSLAGQTMGDLDLPSSVPALGESLRSDDPMIAQVALRRLISKPDTSLEPEVTALLDRGELSLQRLALHTLARFGTPSALAAVQKRSDSSTLGAWAQRELERAPGTPDEVLARRIQSVERGNVRVLSALARDRSEPAQSAILRYFSGTDRPPQLEQVVALAAPSTVERLLERFRASGVEQKRAVVAGLAARGDPKFIDALRTATRDADESIRRSALRGLVEMGDAESVQALGELVKAAGSDDRAFAVELLSARTDPEATRQLETLATDADVQVENSALSALQTRAPELAARLAKQAFQAASAEDRATLLASLDGLPRHLTLPIYDLALQGPDDAIATSAVSSLADRPSPDGAQRLLAVALDASRSQEVRSAAAVALRSMGGPVARANRSLLDTLQAPEETEAYVCEARKE